MILGGFGSHFGSQNGARMGSKTDQNIERFLDRSWKGAGPPKGDHPERSARPGSTGKGREGVKTIPEGKRDFGKKDSWKEGVSKPAVAQRAGGIPCPRFPNDYSTMSRQSPA